MNNQQKKTPMENASNYILSRISVSTLGWSMVALCLAVIIRTIVAAIGYIKLTELECMYMLGNTSVVIFNLLFGVLAFIILLAATIGIFMARNGVLSSDETAAVNGLNMIKYSMIGCIFFTSIFIIISFCSASVLNYYAHTGSFDSRTVSESSASALFSLTFIFGTIAISLEVSLLRIILALLRDMKDGSAGKQGTVLGLSSALVGSFAMITSFCSCLYVLVFQPNNSTSLSSDVFVPNLAINTSNVITAAAMSVVFVTLSVVISKYLMYTDRIRRVRAAEIYNSYYGNQGAQAYPSYATPYNYNYYQPSTYPASNDANRAYKDVYANIYKGTPAPPASELQGKSYTAAKTEYPVSSDKKNTSDTNKQSSSVLEKSDSDNYPDE